jgi:hemoglobin-like flavoprotein
VNAERIRLVQESWEKVVPISETAATLFYGRLFELDPSLRRLFGATTMPEQHKKLMQMITVVVRGLNRIDTLLPTIRQLGQRHVHYGVKESHYETVGAALIWTLEQGLGEAFTDELRHAWVEAYSILSGTMIGASQYRAA